ncbi:MAG: FAD:protein FMN transferase, partial [Deferrisomatales bacterium]|nr:FAD:protein FMN transferase [Deferrisomatales bacterium]
WERLAWEPEGHRLDLGGAALDLGGIAKGYGVDRAVAALRGRGARDFIVDAGGDLFVAGAKGPSAWRVGIQHPREPGSFLRVVSPSEGALVTSGDYERAAHVFDPRTGRPARGCQAVTVWAPDALTADALATAVFVLGPEEGLALLEAEPEAEGLVVGAEGSVGETSGFRRRVPEASPR